MARTSQGPWYRTAAKAWYVSVRGKKVRLVNGPNNAATKRLAYAKWAEVMATVAKTHKGDDNTIAAVVQAYLEWLPSHRKPSTCRNRQAWCTDFAQVHGKLTVRDVKPFHLEKWAERPSWGEATRYGAMVSMIACLSWARKRGLTGTNPLAGTELPSIPSRAMDCVPTDDEHAALLALCNDWQEDVLVTLYDTGCRPGELCKVEGRHLQQREGGWVWVFGHKEAKTARRTVYLTDRVADLCHVLLRLRGEGPIFRTSKGLPWTEGGLAYFVRRLRRRAGIQRPVTPYSWRHKFAVDFLGRGGSVAYLAELMGHKDVKQIFKHYGHLAEQGTVLLRELSRFR
jgi:integrase